MRKVWVVAAAVAVGAVLLTACSGAVDGEGHAKSEASASRPAAAGADAPAADAAKDVKVVSSGVEDHETWGEKAFVVRYEVTNGGDAAADYFVQLEFLDANGDVLGSTGVTADKLGVGKTHKGDTAPLTAEITNGEMADIRSVRVLAVERNVDS